MEATLTASPEVSPEELKNIDAILVIDHSGSMGEPSTRFSGKTKYQELQEDAQAVAREMEKYDTDGITVIAFSSGVNTYDGVTAAKVSQVFNEQPPRGSTNLTDALRSAVDKAKSSNKDCAVLVYTDGSPNDAQTAIDVIGIAGRTLGRPKIGFTFIQVGNDQGAASFLDKLDNGMPVDVVATVRSKDAETLSVPQLIWMARNK